MKKENQITTIEKQKFWPLIQQRETFYPTLKTSNLKEVLDSTSPPLGELIASLEEGKGIAKAIVIQMLTEIVLFVNVGKTMDARNQIPATADLILETYPNLKAEDFKLFCKNFNRGYYGKLFDRLDGQIIMEALHSYFDERTNYFEQKNINDHSARKSAKIDPSETNHEMLKKISEIGKEIKKSEREEVEKRRKLAPISEKSDFEKMIQSFYKEFDEIYKKDSKMNHSGMSGKFIEYKGKNVNQEEYVKIRVKEYCESLDNNT